jgi:hypothetical protein
MAAGVHSDNGHVNASCTSKRMLMEEEKRELQIPVPVKIAFVIITILFFATLLGFSFVIHDLRNVSSENLQLSAKNEILNRENKKRINEIQNSRIETCDSVYTGIYQVFAPFFPPPPRTQQQLQTLEKFNSTIARLKLKCTKLVGAGKN